jgi:tetratricopeptide (TPR) repeat protein
MISSWSQIPQHLVYDDEPLEAILYGAGPAEPTPACIRPVEPNPLLLTVLIDSQDSAALERFYRELAQQVEAGQLLDRAAAASLANVTRKLLPVWPQPLQKPLLPAARTFLECLWRQSRSDPVLAESIGNVLWEWYEYSKRHDAAREILAALAEYCEGDGRLAQAALNLNQLAYQWLMQQNWTAAERAYQRSCELATLADSRRNYLIARVGWWSARFEQDPAGIAEPLSRDMAALVPEIAGHDIVMTQRKALVCLARAEAHLGRIEAALKRLDQAIEIDRQKEAMYLAEDLALQEAMRDRLRR